ncbi:MAG: TIGR04282 family arsenosugar biosynthesis glycosyltransferase [Thermoanaerobaculaceae bacterium]|nr:TIGR04282 family arsenosugar biosynthesis glycosyltransferase [Thermoanaerobaculaceae bacterium]
MRAEVVVFGRVPEVGRVKTRLALAIGGRAAAAAYRVLLERALAEAAASGFPVTLALAEPAAGAAWAPPPGVEVEVQAAGDLGARMAAAFAARFAAGARAVVLVGSDAPRIDAATIRGAAAACGRVPVVLGPALDGGYVLVAQRSPGVAMFADVPWSSADTLAATRARLARLGVDHEELDAVRDIDTGDDLDAALADPALPGDLRRRLEAIVAAARPRR